ncbi:MAG TPA: DNA recombination protein RmuC, partial [Candidatus Didemnitutus sp.]
MDLLIALLSLAVGGALGWFVARSRSAVLAERARRLGEELDQGRRRIAEVEALRAQAEIALAAERATTAEKMAQFADETARLERFKSLSADALRSNNQTFLDLARESFGRLQQQATDDLGKRQEAIGALVKPIRESLDKVDGKIGELEKSRAEAYGKLSEQLQSLGSAQTQLQAEAAKLSVALRSTNTAGTWGELQLRRVVEMAGMTSYCDFFEQETSNDRRADMVVRLPGGQQIVVDAKAPNDAYREAVNATDEAVRSARLAEHAAKVRTHIDA